MPPPLDTALAGRPWLGQFAQLPYDSFMSRPAQDTLFNENARYKRVIRSAEELFKKVGFRAVTMELTSRAKPKCGEGHVYSYFKNKMNLHGGLRARRASCAAPSSRP